MNPSPRRLDEWLGYVAQLHPREIDLGLERISAVAGRLDLRPPRERVITVAGTNGKGSTAAMIAAGLRLRAGLRTALYLSPYVQEFGERIQIDGKYAAEEELCREFERVEAARGDVRLTEFEFITLVALCLFSRERCQAWVLEVGLGGRLDAVNAIDPDVSVITRIAMDHQDWLGGTLEEIAAEKAGILRPGRPAFYGAGKAPDPIAERANELKAPLYQAGVDFDFERSGAGWNWRGRHTGRNGLAVVKPSSAAELANTSLALAVLEGLDPDWVPDQEDCLGVRNAARLPGRFERLRADGVEWVLDVAHNPDAAACLARSLVALPIRRTMWVLGMHEDKDIDGFVAVLPVRNIDGVLVARADGSRACPPERLAEVVESRAHANARRCGSVVEACRAAVAQAGPGGRIVVTGSFGTVGPARAWLESVGAVDSD